MKLYRCSTATLELNLASFSLTLFRFALLLSSSTLLVVVSSRRPPPAPGHHRHHGDLVIPRDGTLLIDYMGIQAEQQHSDQVVNQTLGNVDWDEQGSHGILRERSYRRALNVRPLGSTPPKCVSKCYKCTPCYPIRVPIEPGQAKISLMEYYPEAWRCKCKNKLYMP